MPFGYQEAFFICTFQLATLELEQLPFRGIDDQLHTLLRLPDSHSSEESWHSLIFSWSIYRIETSTDIKDIKISRTVYRIVIDITWNTSAYPYYSTYFLRIS